MRSKGGAADYRYVAEPDLPPGRLPEGLVDQIRSSLPELPAAFRKRLSSEEMGLPAADVLVLSDEASTARFFSEALDSLPPSSSPSPPRPLPLPWSSSSPTGSSGTSWRTARRRRGPWTSWSTSGPGRWQRWSR